MGIASTTDFTVTENNVNSSLIAERVDGTIEIPDRWKMVKSGGNHILIVDYPTIGPTSYSYAFRLTKHATGPAFCDTTRCGRTLVLYGNMDVGDWDKELWMSVYNNQEREIVTGGFYDEYLGKLCMVNRKKIPRTRTSLPHSMQRHYNLRHLRPLAGIPEGLIYKGLSDVILAVDIGATVDGILGPTKTMLDVATDKREPQYYPWGGVTLAYAMEPVEGSENFKVSYSLSVCSKKDLYNRKIGAENAVRKLERYLRDSSLTPFIGKVVSNDGSRKVLFHGVNSFHLTTSRDRVRPTTADGKYPYFEFIIDFLTDERQLQQRILEHAFTSLIESDTRMYGVASVLFATMLSLVYSRYARGELIAQDLGR